MVNSKNWSWRRLSVRWPSWRQLGNRDFFVQRSFCLTDWCLHGIVHRSLCPQAFSQHGVCSWKKMFHEPWCSSRIVVLRLFSHQFCQQVAGSEFPEKRINCYTYVQRWNTSCMEPATCPNYDMWHLGCVLFPSGRLGVFSIYLSI